MFVTFLFVVATAFPILAVLGAITFLTPTWHWPIAFIALLAIALAALWAQHWYVASFPGYKEGPAGGLGVYIVAIWTSGFAIASAAFIGGLIWWRAHEQHGHPNPTRT